MGKMHIDTTPTGVVNTVPAAPLGSNFYFFSAADVPGVVAANTFMSIFNPVGNAKTLVFYTSRIDAWATAATSVAVSMRISRITAASAGTLVAAANVPKFVTTAPNTTAEVRTGNPTVTITQLLLGTPPAITGAGTGITALGGGGPVPPGAGFVCLPGEGVSISTPSGDVDQLWNWNFIWAEM